MSDSSEPPRDPVQRIVVADDDPLVRSAVRTLLADQPDLIVVGEAADEEEAVASVLRVRPEVLLLDAGLDAVSVIERVRDQAPDVQVVVFSAVDDADRGVAELRSGASGFLLKEMSGDALLRALRGLAHGEAPLSRALTLRVVEQLHRDAAPSDDELRRWARLTPIEWQVLDAIRVHGSLAAAAEALGLPTERARDHLERVLLVLGVAGLDAALADLARLRARAPWSGSGIPLDEVTRRRLARRPPDD